MHILLNGQFLTQPTVGSGQYLHGLLRWLPQVAPSYRYTVLAPTTGASLPPPTAGVAWLPLATPFDGQRRNMAKVWFEQVAFPRFVAQVAKNTSRQVVAHVPYFAPPLLRSNIVPLITTIPDVIPLLLPAYQGGRSVQAYMGLVSRSAHRSTHTITFSQHSKNDIAARLRLPPARISVTLLAAEERYQPLAPAAVPAARAALAARYGITTPFIYYVGGLDERKNVLLLLWAAARLRDAGKLHVPVIIAGKPLGADRRLFPDIEATIADLRLTGHVRRVDVPYADGVLFYQLCRVFAFPSRYEGFGLPPLEAMACGAPVVCSSTSSLPEVVGDAAVMLPPDDVDGWAAALDRVLHDDRHAADLRERGLARAARFHWERVARETVAIYQRISDNG